MCRPGYRIIAQTNEFQLINIEIVGQPMCVAPRIWVSHRTKQGPRRFFDVQLKNSRYLQLKIVFIYVLH